MRLVNSGAHAAGQQPGIIRRFLSFIVCIAVVLVAAWGIRTYVAEPFEVPSASMETTIMTGDRLFAEKVSYHFEDPKAGDIVVFSDPQVPSRVLVKRVIATEGQVVSMSDGVLYIDGVAQSEPYVTGETYPLSQTAGNVSISYPYIVPEGEVWVMGDNRENSSDSRYFGSIDENTIFGKAVFTYWPINRIGLL
ncbi:MAG TPA: signal peptidase I [Eggerthellaceae bacterium]|nr:signal peptidase I [Eggerthellaceae bacterium]